MSLYDPDLMDKGIRRGFMVQKECDSLIDCRKVEIIRLYIKDKLSYREIQTRLKVSPRVIKKTIVLALKAYPFLKKYLP